MAPDIARRNVTRDISKIVKFIDAAYTAKRVNKADCVVPYKTELTIPRGELRYNSFNVMLFNFLKLGGFLFVSKIGINANDIITDINIKGSKFSGLLKFKKNIPIPIAPYKTII